MKEEITVYDVSCQLPSGMPDKVAFADKWHTCDHVSDLSAHIYEEIIPYVEEQCSNHEDNWIAFGVLCVLRGLLQCVAEEYDGGEATYEQAGVKLSIHSRTREPFVHELVAETAAEARSVRKIAQKKSTTKAAIASRLTELEDSLNQVRDYLLERDL